MLETYRTDVLPEWTDYNGHLRDAHYLLLFSFATDALMDHLGLDAAGRARTGHTLYTLEVHLNYLAEVKVSETVCVMTQLVGRDRKRLHVYHALYRGETLAAASEQMLMNIDTATGRSAVFEETVEKSVEALMKTQCGMEKPAYCGRVIGLPAGR
ncbi:thioesterase family protein [Pseudomonas matsuisoli]|uniref:Carnitine dehydrogenase n=1 Tax=Pseudomonas matsuisoli TaxID=1515666 RepID=A0A917Q0S7_9PSED|nr:thioesterase family protein [Pseudomonas matsuisoli]GGK04179.1 carnitine dehydrogenase [Pseudomonas matsuisoli]